MGDITIAKSAGFCFGVQRAVQTVCDEIKNEKGTIYTLGPIIHNEQVVRDFAARGVHVLTEDDLNRPYSPTDVIIIRSHGISKSLHDKLMMTGAKIVDATCPFVQKIHTIVKNESKNGRHILIIGSGDHPEVIGIRGWVSGPCDVVESEEDVRRVLISPEMKVCVVSQTTFNHEKFQYLVEIISHLVYDSIVLDTVCNATSERQTEAGTLAVNSDIMLVIGSKTSSNTQKLYDICRALCKDTYYIETLDDLVTVHIHSDSRVGITAGASAPNYIIQEVFAECQKNKALSRC